VLVVAGCGFHHGVLPSSDGQVDASIDTPPDGPEPCITRWFDGTIRFGTPLALAGVNSPADSDRDMFLTRDELTIYFASDRGGPLEDVYVATRTAIGQPFVTPVVFAPASTAGDDTKMSMTDDGLLLVVATDRAGGQGAFDIWQATRSSASNSWGALDESHEGMIDNASDQFDPLLSSDGLRLYYSDGIPQKVVVASRTSRSMNFGSPVVVAGIDDPANQADPALTSDELLIVFTAARASAFTGANLWYSVRSSTSDAFGPAQEVPDLNTNSNEGDSWLSSDGCRLYFASDRAGSYDIYVATAL
jgi:Tol biopolymer transport system component